MHKKFEIHTLKIALRESRGNLQFSRIYC